MRKRLNASPLFLHWKIRQELFPTGPSTSLGHVRDGMLDLTLCSPGSFSLVVMLSILTCSFFVILYSLEWGAKRANEWLMTMMLSFGQSILVIDPLKVFVITAIISFLIRRPYDDETLDFSDPFTATLVSNENLADSDDHDRSNDLKVKGSVDNRSSKYRYSVRLFDFRNCTSTTRPSVQSATHRLERDGSRTPTTLARDQDGRHRSRNRHVRSLHRRSPVSLVSITGHEFVRILS